MTSTELHFTDLIHQGQNWLPIFTINGPITLSMGNSTYLQATLFHIYIYVFIDMHTC